MSYDPNLYALLHRGTPGDLDFYRDAVRGARHVLELGCGFGRVLGELARAGQRVTGLDIDPAMVELARRARAALAPEQATLITLAQGDMRRFALAERFERVIIPYNGIYCMLSEQAVVDCLRCCRAHLRRNGAVVFDAYAIDDFHAHADPQMVNSLDGDEEAIESICWQDTVYDVFETCQWDRNAQRLEVSYTHVPRDGGAVQRGSIAHRYLLTTQVAALCRRAGLELVQLCEDFNGTPLTPDAEHMTCVARKR